jgi:hypothetical protein
MYEGKKESKRRKKKKEEADLVKNKSRNMAQAAFKIFPKGICHHRKAIYNI